MVDRGEIDDAIATLARELQGVLEVARLGGIESLPKPAFLKTPSSPRAEPASAPAAPMTATSEGSTGQGPSASAGKQEMPAPAIEEVPPPVAAPSRQPAAGLPIVDDALAALLASSGDPAEKLERLRAEVIGECTRCKLHRGRGKLVFGVGNPQADLVFVGEGPGADEDRQGIPFVGRAGQLLTKMIEAMGQARDDVYICNVVKCRPPNNRDPEPDEVEACESFLKAQLAIVKPKVIVCLGRHAAQTLLRTKTPLGRLRGNWHEYEGIPLMPTYHPSFLLREEADPAKARKREAWGDLKKVMHLLSP